MANTFYPLISIIIPTLNNEKDIEHFFLTLKKQLYPKDKVEILVMDGGSSDKTIIIAKKYHARVIHNPYKLADPGVKLGFQKAKGDLLMVLAVDNEYKSNHSFFTIAKIFQQDLSLFAAFPKHDSRKNDSLFTKYINTFTDPFNHFVYGDASNARTFKRKYKTICSNKIYDIYNFFTCEDRPLVSLAQGFVLRKGSIKNNANYYDDISPIAELISKKKKIAYMHSLSLYHETYKNFSEFIRKQRWATLNAMLKKNYGVSHRYKGFSNGQKIRVMIWPIYGMSIVGPLIRAIIGVVVDKELIWLMHPFLCLVSVMISTYTILLYFFNKQANISRN